MTTPAWVGTTNGDIWAVVVGASFVLTRLPGAPTKIEPTPCDSPISDQANSPAHSGLCSWSLTIRSTLTLAASTVWATSAMPSPQGAHFSRVSPPIPMDVNAALPPTRKLTPNRLAGSAGSSTSDQTPWLRSVLAMTCAGSSNRSCSPSCHREMSNAIGAARKPSV